MRLAVTGAGGLLGSALLKEAKGRYETYALYCQHLPSSGTPLRVDLRDPESITKTLFATRPDAIIHAAAMTDVDGCEREQTLADAVNHKATEAIAECARELGAFLVYVSTDYVFDGARGMYSEDDDSRPINFYGRTKLEGEEAVRRLLPDHLIVRPSVIYGATPSSGKVNFALWVLDSLRQRKQVNVVSDQFVSPTLNSDLSEMVMECLEKRVVGTLHLSGATRLSRFDFASELCAAWSLDPSLITPVELSAMTWHAPRPKDSSLDVTKAGTLLSKKPPPVAESVKRLKRELDLAGGAA